MKATISTHETYLFQFTPFTLVEILTSKQRLNIANQALDDSITESVEAKYKDLPRN